MNLRDDIKALLEEVLAESDPRAQYNHIEQLLMTSKQLLRRKMHIRLRNLLAGLFVDITDFLRKNEEDRVYSWPSYGDLNSILEIYVHKLETVDLTVEYVSADESRRVILDLITAIECVLSDHDAFSREERIRYPPRIGFEETQSRFPSDISDVLFDLIEDLDDLEPEPQIPDDFRLNESIEKYVGVLSILVCSDTGSRLDQRSREALREILKRLEKIRNDPNSPRRERIINELHYFILEECEVRFPPEVESALNRVLGDLQHYAARPEWHPEDKDRYGPSELEKRIGENLNNLGALEQRLSEEMKFHDIDGIHE
jgi:hypothetical protein